MIAAGRSALELVRDARGGHPDHYRAVGPTGPRPGEREADGRKGSLARWQGGRGSEVVPTAPGAHGGGDALPMPATRQPDPEARAPLGTPQLNACSRGTSERRCRIAPRFMPDSARRNRTKTAPRCRLSLQAIDALNSARMRVPTVPFSTRQVALIAVVGPLRVDFARVRRPDVIGCPTCPAESGGQPAVRRLGGGHSP